MSARSALAVLAAIFGMLGLTSGLVEWTLHMYVLPDTDYGEPFMSIANLVWLGEVVCFGGAIILLGVAVALPVPAPIYAAAPAAPTPAPEVPPVSQAVPPPIPDLPPKESLPAEQTREAADLWQSEDAPFPPPPDIEHPSDGPDLWQSEHQPFPEVDVDEEEEHAEEPPPASPPAPERRD